MLRISGGWTILCVLTFLFGITALKGITYRPCDLLVLLYISYCLISYPIFGDFPSDIYIAAIRDQIFPMSFYFFARNRYTKNCGLLPNAIYPFIIAYIIGIFLFFTAPGWYIDYRLNGDYNQSQTNYFNLTRMSSFWSSSYCVGYSTIFIIIYTINKAIFEKQKIRHFGFVLTISFISLFLAQQRISIGFAGLYLSVILWVLANKKIINPKKFISILTVIVAICAVIGIILSHYLDPDYITYAMERFSNNEDGIIEDRINLFEDYIPTISLMGQGFGKYSHNALFHSMPSITDCEFIRTANEVGVLGLVLLLIIIVSSLYENYKKGRKYSFESFVVLFYLLAMVGATPLEVSQHQPFMFWFCVGKLRN